MTWRPLRRMEIYAPAKINLTLDVTSQRPDGYHEVVMVMQSVALCDRIRLTPAEAGIDLRVNMPGLAADTSNLAWQAAALLRSYAGVTAGVRIDLEKHIPLAAGLAGGSTDAAAVLKGLNILWGLQLTEDELMRLGARLGSDVPFCLRGGTMLATGRGERVSPLPPLPPCWVVLAKPAVAVSTAWAYQRFSPAAVRRRPDTAGVIAALQAGDFTGVAVRLANVLESVTMAAYPRVAVLKRAMQRLGLAALMSGSGPTVFGLTQDEALARYAWQRLRRLTAEVYLTQTIGAGEV